MYFKQRKMIPDRNFMRQGGVIRKNSLFQEKTGRELGFITFNILVLEIF